MGEEASQPIWHLSRGGKQYGPISGDHLLRLAELGKLRPDDLLWKPGFTTWRTALSIPGLLTPPVPPHFGTTTSSDEPGQSQAETVEQPAQRRQQDGPAKPNDLRSLWRHYHPEAKEPSYRKASTATLVISAFIFPGLWAQDFTSMSIYWVARPPAVDN